MSKPTYYRTVVVVEILSSYQMDFTSIKQVHEAITFDGCAGAWRETVSNEPLTEKQTRKKLIEMGCDPSFLISDNENHEDGTHPHLDGP